MRLQFNEPKTFRLRIPPVDVKSLLLCVLYGSGLVSFGLWGIIFALDAVYRNESGKRNGIFVYLYEL